MSHVLPESPGEMSGPTVYSPGFSKPISQRTAYEMLSALKLVVKMMDMHGPGIFGPMAGYIRATEKHADRETK